MQVVLVLGFADGQHQAAYDAGNGLLGVWCDPSARMAGVTFARVEAVDGPEAAEAISRVIVALAAGASPPPQRDDQARPGAAPPVVRWIRRSVPTYGGGEQALAECGECHALVWGTAGYAGDRPALIDARAEHEDWHARAGR